MRTQRVVAYRIPEQTFVENADRFWISADPVEPLEVVDLGTSSSDTRRPGSRSERSETCSVLGRGGRIELGYSGIRLRNARS